MHRILRITSLGLTVLSTLHGLALHAEEHPSAQILPSSVELTGKDATQQLLLQSIRDNGSIGKSVQAPIAWTIVDSDVATLENGMVKALQDGESTIQAKWTSESGEAKEVSIPLKVQGTGGPKNVEFGNHIEAILAKAACNTGACHGALAGKGGFKLSLNGYDAMADHFTSTAEDKGRRIDLDYPERSLLLLKPTGKVAHKGGVRLKEDCEDYRTILRWITDGAMAPQEADPKLQILSVYPAEVELAAGDHQKIVATARYNNGRVEDISQWAKFTSTNESVASVDAQGNITVMAPGQSSINVWFASRIESVRVVVPYTDNLPSDAFVAFTETNPIDGAVGSHLERLNLAPSEKCSDQEFVRRVYLDTIGQLPTPDEVRSFMSSDDAEKRTKLIDALLERPEYVDYWAYRWSDLFMLNGALLQVDGVKAYYEWIHNHVAKNTPWNEFAHEILTATGEALNNGATNFYALNQDPESMTENACQAFMGLSIGCAKCHNHPLEKWTNDQYYSMANMFARVRAKGWAGEVRNGTAERTLVVLDRGDLIQPNRGKPQPPAPLDAPALDFDDPTDRRIALSKWMTSPDNPYFTRAIVNRVWHAYFGVGIVDPVDDLRESNPESNPELMKYLCDYLVANDYDLKSLMRLILSSATYQRSSVTRLNNENDTRYFSHYYPRRLMGEVLLDCIVQVTSVDSSFTQIEFPGNDHRKVDFYPKGTRAVQLYDSAVENKFLRSFGRNQRRIVCECERSNEPSVVQVLHINNGETINDKLADSNSIVTQYIAQYADQPAEMIRNAYMRCLSREPSESELQNLVKELPSKDDAGYRIAIEDLFWSLMSSREFLFSH